MATMNANRTDRMIGESSSFLEVQERVSQIAPLTKPVLIVGERGTGKELIAARVHYLSERWGQPYLTVNCAAISDSLMETELFGHEAGAFSGAIKQHKGYFERADGGTLFLDELATTSMRVQEKILRLIEYGELIRVGGNQVLELDVRLVAATNGDLPTLAKQNKFRSDLLDRLAFDVITLPPLRARRDDIPLLAEFFATEMVKQLHREYFPGFRPETMRELIAYEWPGNIRELKNVVERAVYRTEADVEIDTIIFDPFASPYRPLSLGLGRDNDGVGEENRLVAKLKRQALLEDESVTSDDIEQEFADLDLPAFSGVIDLKQRVSDYETELIRNAYESCQYNQKRTAEQLGLSYHQLRGYLRKYAIK